MEVECMSAKHRNRSAARNAERRSNQHVPERKEKERSGYSTKARVAAVLMIGLMLVFTFVTAGLEMIN